MRTPHRLVAVRRAGWIVALSVCGLLALAYPAAAPATRSLQTGFADFNAFGSSDPAVRATWLNRAIEARAGILRLDFYWSSVAGPTRPPDPTNPGSTSYDFSTVDAAVRDAEARGLVVLLNIQSAPTWAEAPGRPPSAAPGTWKPSPSDLADFLRAVASRYSGGFDPDGPGPQAWLPEVQALQIWNEPNHPVFLAPQYEGQTAVSPALYRAMLNAGYSAVKAVNPQMLVVTAGLSPYGDPPGGARVRPVEFWRDLLCVRQRKGKRKKGKKGKKKKGKKRKRFVKVPGCTGPAMFDVLAHHPINTSAGPLRPAINPDDASSADMGRIASVLRGAETVGAVLPGRHPIWADEFWWDSNPPNPAGVPLPVQARYLEEQLFLLWKDGASVAINQLIRDRTVGPQGIRIGLQGGIFFANGQPKPAYTAFRFPFVTERINQRKLFAWGKAPAGGKLVIQRKRRGRWHAVKKRHVGQGAVFTATLPLQGKQRLRAAVAGNRSLIWKEPDPTLVAWTRLPR